ncbi:restriction endonuclease subunit S [Hoylesella nanceiensis]|nr:restriction endonuclease subunit S [Hoylesella nanceiensis]
MANSSDTPHYENVPFEVPENWEWTTLGEIGTWQSGATPSRLRKDYYGGNIPWLKTGDLNDGLITDIPEFITQKALDETSVKLNPIGSILIAMYGATIGKIGILTFPATTNQACCACSDYKIEQMYLFYFLLANKKVFIAMGGGGAQPNISKEKIAVTFMPLPPLTEQQRIVVEIERWFKLIDAIDQSKADLQTTITQTKSKILDLAIHGKLVPQDPNDEPASELLKRINPKAEITCDNEHSRKLPYNWCLCNLGDVCMLENGFAFSSDQYKAKGIPLIRISNIKDNEISLSSCVFINEGYEEKYIVHSGDLLIAMSGATTGKMGIYNQKYVAYLNQRVGNIKIVDSNLLFDKYRNYFLFSQKNKILELAYGGAQPNISGKVINSLFVPLPPIAEQKRIVQKIEVLFSIIDTVEQALQA